MFTIYNRYYSQVFHINVFRRNYIITFPKEFTPLDNLINRPFHLKFRSIGLHITSVTKVFNFYSLCPMLLISTSIINITFLLYLDNSLPPTLNSIVFCFASIFIKLVLLRQFHLVWISTVNNPAFDLFHTSIRA